MHAPARRRSHCRAHAAAHAAQVAVHRLVVVPLRPLARHHLKRAHHLQAAVTGGWGVRGAVGSPRARGSARTRALARAPQPCSSSGDGSPRSRQRFRSQHARRCGRGRGNGRRYGSGRRGGVLCAATACTLRRRAATNSNGRPREWRQPHAMLTAPRAPGCGTAADRRQENTRGVKRGASEQHVLGGDNRGVTPTPAPRAGTHVEDVLAQQVEARRDAQAPGHGDFARHRVQDACDARKDGRRRRWLTR
jgi:hypothetical protein